MVLTYGYTACLIACMSPIEKAITAAGGLTALAGLINTTPQVIQHWRTRGIPAERVIALESATGITRSELRPDLYPEITQ